MLADEAAKGLLAANTVLSASCLLCYVCDLFCQTNTP